MKAIVQHTFGDANVLTYTDMDTPVITDNEVLIKTAYTSVNYADIKNRVGDKSKGKFPLVLGLDAAGIIEAVSPNSEFSVGDRVIAFPANGSYAEYVVANEQLVFKIPDQLPFDQAATMPVVSFLSHLLLFEIGQVKKEDIIVIHSAAGGVGSTLVQMAKLAGIQTIIGTVGNMDKEPYVKELGATAVYTYETFSAEVLKMTNNSGAQVIFDSMAGEVTQESLACLAIYGTLVQFGNSSGKAGIIKTSDVHSSCRNIKGFSLGTTRKLAPERLKSVATEVIELFASRKISIPIAHVYQLKDASLAHKLIESRNHKGKVLLKM